MFRLFGPVFIGCLAYLLILMVYNNIDQLQEQFLTWELLVCILLSFIIQEFSRWSFRFFDKLKWTKSFIWNSLFKTTISFLIAVFLVSGGIYIYYIYYKLILHEYLYLRHLSHQLLLVSFLNKSQYYKKPIKKCTDSDYDHRRNEIIANFISELLFCCFSTLSLLYKINYLKE